MAKTEQANTARSIVDAILGAKMVREIWSGNYEKVLPISVQGFDLTAVLPAMFYMFRFGHRRGKGRFLDTFGGEGTITQKKKAATVGHIATILSNSTQSTFAGFNNEVEQAILGDLLLSYCLENSGRALGRQEQVIRVAPPHYMASWIDLPIVVVNLRFVPEMLVAILADQQAEFVEQNKAGDNTKFAVGKGFEDNLLLKVFRKGIMELDKPGDLSSHSADRFDESAEVGIDQLLMIRLAQQLGQAPDKLRGSEGDRISNQRPIAELASRNFSEDLRYFISNYAEVLPRHTFVEMLEACMALGLTSIYTSVVEILLEWVETGRIREKSQQHTTALFVDCSNGIDMSLRAIAEQSMDDFMRRSERIPVIMMAMRLLDYQARYERSLKKREIKHRPYATEWINLLGDLLMDRCDESRDILRDLERYAQSLSEAFEADYPEAAEILMCEQQQPNPVWRLAETLTFLQGRHNTVDNLVKMIDSCLMIDRPNGLAKKRSVNRLSGGAGRKKREVRSIVFTDALLDQLVHLHVLDPAETSGYRLLSFAEFIQILRVRHGFFVDIAPPGIPASNELLLKNRSILERRLRDLGLLVGVNDAESMKHLKPRFRPACGDTI